VPGVLSVRAECAVGRDAPRLRPFRSWARDGHVYGREFEDEI
jgi:hypothetical protein